VATGDVTSTYEGTFDIGAAALITELDTLNTGAATAGADTKSIILVPTANGKQISIFTIARAA
jgi:hypothetical protein|tara:strand:- start:742 stop:930 length:189 start_codon:yes stop_codon:yes gene_type:complete